MTEIRVAVATQNRRLFLLLDFLELIVSSLLPSFNAKIVMI